MSGITDQYSKSRDVAMGTLMPALRLLEEKAAQMVAARWHVPAWVGEVGSDGGERVHRSFLQLGGRNRDSRGETGRE